VSITERRQGKTDWIVWNVDWIFSIEEFVLSLRERTHREADRVDLHPGLKPWVSWDFLKIQIIEAQTPPFPRASALSTTSSVSFAVLDTVFPIASRVA